MHVLGTQQAFILSQDQTLEKIDIYGFTYNQFSKNYLPNY